MQFIHTINPNTGQHKSIKNKAIVDQYSILTQLQHCNQSPHQQTKQSHKLSTNDRQLT